MLRAADWWTNAKPNLKRFRRVVYSQRSLLSFGSAGVAKSKSASGTTDDTSHGAPIPMQTTSLTESEGNDLNSSRLDEPPSKKARFVSVFSSMFRAFTAAHGRPTVAQKGLERVDTRCIALNAHPTQTNRRCTHSTATRRACRRERVAQQASNGRCRRTRC
jgi:hypothetical protein